MVCVEHSTTAAHWSTAAAASVPCCSSRCLVFSIIWCRGTHEDVWMAQQVEHFHCFSFGYWWSWTLSRLLTVSGWLGSRVVSLLDSGAEGPGFKSQSLSGNSLRQTVHTHRASVHQAANWVAALLRVSGVTAGLAESNGSLPSGLWFTSPAGWLPRTEINSGTLRSVIEYGLPLPFLTVFMASQQSSNAGDSVIGSYWLKVDLFIQMQPWSVFRMTAGFMLVIN